jgi:5-methylthioadenosine/S-adenosylhomocysteine deaminase
VSGWLIKDTLIVPLTGDAAWFHGDIAIIDDQIAAVGPDLAAAYSDLKTIPGRGYITMPGLVNAHTHGAMNLLRGAGDDLPLKEWLFQRIFPLEDRLTARLARAGCMSAVLEMIQSGTTAFADSYFFMDEMAKAVLQSGMRANLSRGLQDLPGGDTHRLREACDFVRRWQGQAEGRIKCWLAPHSPFTCSTEYLKKVMETAAELGVGMQIHIAETREEFNNSLMEHDKTPIERLADLGFFDTVPVLAAHCVWITEEDRTIIKQKNIRVVHNPQSNMKLGSGIAPIPALMANGVEVALGTDGAASNNNLDMWEEMRAAAMLHKVNLTNPTLMPAAQVLQMTGPMGARAIGFEGCGTIAAGQKADLIMINLDQANMRPLIDPISQLVYSAGAGNVDTVMVDGQLLMRHREMLTLDEERILFEVQKAGEELMR